MKIFNLVLCSPDLYYDQMKEVLSKHYANHRLTKDNTIKTFFYWFDPNIDTTIKVISDDVVLVKGNETMIPGILQKTMSIMKWAVDNFDFDYLLRSSVSTLVDFDELVSFLVKNEVHYGGHLQLNVLIQAWVDPDIGIVDQTKIEVQYAQGTSITFSRKVAQILTKDITKIDYSLMDDVSFGWKMRELQIPFVRLLQKSNLSEIQSGVIFYRNKTKGEREKDVNNIQRLSLLLNQRDSSKFVLNFGDVIKSEVISI